MSRSPTLECAPGMLEALPQDLPAMLPVTEAQAVLVHGGAREDWRQELSSAVEHGAFAIPRTVLHRAGIDDLTQWLELNLPHSGVSKQTRDALLSDILDLAHLQLAIASSSNCSIRLFTERPSRRCGLHLDTVRPGAAIWGLLRVYDAEGPCWVDSNNVRSMACFYRWLAGRDAIAHGQGAHAGIDPATRDARLAHFDQDRSFLFRPDELFAVPTGATLAFRHLDASLHWSDHDPKLAWLHGSPMQGETRLVVNVSPG